MRIITDPTTDADGVPLSEEEPGDLPEKPPGDANPNYANESNEHHLLSKTTPGTEPDLPAADGAGAKPSFEFSPAPAHVHRTSQSHTGGTGLFSFLSGGIHHGASGSVALPRGGSGGIPRHGSGGILRHGSGGIPRHGSGGVGPRRGGSGTVGGGIHRGRSGVHLPSLTSITFSMSRLPEEDAGLQMHFTETREVETFPDSPVATDDESGPGKPRSRMRKHLTAVGACSFGFRFSECVLSLISFVVMCANSKHMAADVGTLKFNHFQAYRFLVAVNVIVFVYSTLQFIQLAYTVCLGISFIPSIILSTWLTFGLDQFFAYLLLSASTSAATVANMSYTGEMGVRLCSRYDLGSFCAMADAAVTMSFFTFLAMLSSTILAIYRIAAILREY